MADKTPEELQAENARIKQAADAEIERRSQAAEAEITRLKQANDDLRRTNADLRKGGGKADVTLQQENDALRAKLGEVKAQAGPEPGTPVCFQRGVEPFCRPGKILSDGFTEAVQRTRQDGAATTDRHAHILYAEHPDHTVENRDGELVKPKTTFETDKPYDPMGGPDTWHLQDECPHKGDATVCPYKVGVKVDPHKQAP